MISSVLRFFSLLIIFSSLGAVIFTLYAMSNDLSKIRFKVEISDLKVTGSNVHLTVKLHLNYSGNHDLNVFKVSLKNGERQYSSSPITVKPGVNIITIPCILPLNILGGNFSASMIFSLSYGGVIPINIETSKQPLFPIYAFTFPSGVESSIYNSTHTSITVKVRSTGFIGIPVIAKLYTNETSYKTYLGTFEAYEEKTAKWNIPLSDLPEIRGINIYLEVEDELVKVAEWRFYHG
ncbi:MAG: hypothetical protein DRJ30_04075 [Candidatus Methanomethylicota archaeon]|nr:MAG: hypothetical protein DRJ30_04075 [Candidatus Verstraetearchaeota archaeon]